jgi:hypothetical protein
MQERLDQMQGRQILGILLGHLSRRLVLGGDAADRWLEAQLGVDLDD